MKPLVFISVAQTKTGNIVLKRGAEMLICIISTHPGREITYEEGLQFNCTNENSHRVMAQKRQYQCKRILRKYML